MDTIVVINKELGHGPTDNFRKQISRMRALLKKFKSYFSESKWSDYIKNEASRFGAQLLYAGLLLFYAYKRSDTPHWAKNIVIGALGYLIAPIDVLPDLTPLLGFTDDFGVLSFALVMISCYINDEVKTLSKERLQYLNVSIDDSAIAEVEKVL